MISSKRLLQSHVFSGDSFASGDYVRFKFEANRYACTTLIFLLFRFHFAGEVIAYTEGRINLVHFFVVSAGVFLPFLYALLFIGHYSKLGCFVLSRVIPLAHGVGYTMLIISLAHAVYEVAIVSDSLEFVYLSILGESPWMVCESQYGYECVGKAEVQQCRAHIECIENYTQFSVYNYRYYHLQQYEFVESKIDSANPPDQLIHEDHFWKIFDGHRVPFLFVGLVLAVIISDLSIPSQAKITDFLLFATVCMYLLIIFVAFHKYTSVTEALFVVFTINVETLWNVECWYDTAIYLIKNLSIPGVYVMLIGSYLPDTSLADLQAFVVWIGLMFLHVLSEFGSCVMRSVVSAVLHTPFESLKSDNRDGTVMLIHYHMFLGLFAPGKLLSCSCYLLIATVSLIRVRLILAAMYHTMADNKPVIRLYKFYIRIFSGCWLFCLAFPMCIVGATMNFLVLIRYIECCLCTLALVIASTGILYFYGTHTLCDDHHFMYGSQPAIFFKITLLVCPLIFILVGGYLFIKMSNIRSFEPNIELYFYIIFAIVIMPQIAGLVYIATYYLKQQNMAHLLKYEDNWGDPNSNIRKDRIIYHPRKETNYFRRINVCNHECLRYNTLCPIVIKEEDTLHEDGYRLLKDGERFPGVQPLRRE